MKKILLGSLLMVFALGSRAAAETFIVTSNADNGPGTLREAIDASNTTTGVQTIVINTGSAINISGIGMTITSPVIIEGNFNTISATSSYLGGLFSLSSGSDGSIIRNMAVVKTSGLLSDAFFIYSSERNTIENCAIGTDWNCTGGYGFGHGINIYGDVTRCLGKDVIKNNLIGGNSQGIYCEFSNGNTICGNIIGLNPSTNQPISNTDGIVLSSSNYNIIGGNDQARNIISGNTNRDLSIQYGKQNTITRNYFGCDTTGSVAVSVGNTRIAVNAGYGFNVIGEKETRRGNVILGGLCGIETNDWDYTEIYGNVIRDFTQRGIYIKDQSTSCNWSSPRICLAHSDKIAGDSQSLDYIEIYRSSADQNNGLEIMGYCYADGAGKWILNGSFKNGDWITALSTDKPYSFANYRITSEFSARIKIDDSMAPLGDLATFGEVSVGQMTVYGNLIDYNKYTQCMVVWNQPETGATTIRLIDQSGRLVTTLVNNVTYQSNQTNRFTWTPSWLSVASGIYAIHIQSAKFSHYKRIIVRGR